MHAEIAIVDLHRMTRVAGKRRANGGEIWMEPFTAEERAQAERIQVQYLSEGRVTDIPDFLRVDAAEGAARRKWNAEHPIAVVTFSGETEAHRQDREDAQARLKAEAKEHERQLQQAAADRKREELQKSGHTSVPLPGMIWSATFGKYVQPVHMTPAKFKRMMSEMYTPGLRKTLIKLYGSGQIGASAGVAGSATDVTSHPTARESMPAGRVSGKSRSALTGAGRVRVPSEPQACAGIPAHASSKPAAAGDWKAGMIAMLGRPEGATLAEIAATYGWQEKSASARLSGIRKERAITTTAEARGRVHRTEPQP